MKKKFIIFLLTVLFLSPATVCAAEAAGSGDTPIVGTTIEASYLSLKDYPRPGEIEIIEKGEGEGDPSFVRTGDQSNMTVWLVLLLAFGALLLLLLCRRRALDEQEDYQ